MFRPSDVRRVQKAYDDALPAPYEASVTLEDGRKTMRATILDPDDEGLTVAQAVWWYDGSKLNRLNRQPGDIEVDDIVAQHAAICTAYPAKKAADAAYTAEREARAKAKLEAQIAEAAAEIARLEALAEGDADAADANSGA